MGALKPVLDTIATTCSKLGRSNARLVAVSKLNCTEKILDVYGQGQRHFGENYVQELLDKCDVLPIDIAWHFIGHLQSNKASKLVRNCPNLWMVESVDSTKLAGKLDSAVEAQGRDPLRVMIQVNTSQESSKDGIAVEDVMDLAVFIHSECAHLNLVGLMTIGKMGDPCPAPYFQLLASTRDLVSKQLGVDLELSMGMSGDYVTALEHGSTNVRVGSTIFGARK